MVRLAQQETAAEKAPKSHEYHHGWHQEKGNLPVGGASTHHDNGSRVTINEYYAALGIFKYTIVATVEQDCNLRHIKARVRDHSRGR